MIDARVAGVPMPESFIASRSSSSSIVLAGRLHRAEQRRVGVAPRRLRLLPADATSRVVDGLALLELRQRAGRARVVVGLPRLASSPRPRRRRPASRLEQHAAAGAEDVLGDRRSPPACARRRRRDGRRRGSAARPGRRPSARRRDILSRRWSERVGMIAWWSVTLASLTTRPSGSSSSPRDVLRGAPRTRGCARRARRSA